MEHFTNLVVVGAMLIAGSGVGLLLLDALRLEGGGRPQQVLLASGLGLGLIGYVPFVLGLSGGLNTPALLATLLVAVAVGLAGWYGFVRRSDLEWPRNITKSLRGQPWELMRRLGPVGLVLVGFIALMGLLNLLAAMAPVIKPATHFR